MEKGIRIPKKLGITLAGPNGPDETIIYAWYFAKVKRLKQLLSEFEACLDFEAEMIIAGDKEIASFYHETAKYLKRKIFALSQEIRCI